MGKGWQGRAGVCELHGHENRGRWRLLTPRALLQTRLQHIQLTTQLALQCTHATPCIPSSATHVHIQPAQPF